MYSRFSMIFIYGVKTSVSNVDVPWFSTRAQNTLAGGDGRGFCLVYYKVSPVSPVSLLLQWKVLELQLLVGALEHFFWLVVWSFFLRFFHVLGMS